MKSLDLNLLCALDALLTAGSVSGAAQAMHLSTPAMSHTLARIRDALGDAILVRAGRRLVPTPRAVELREPVHRLIDEARGLMQPVDARALVRMQREFIVRAPDGMPILYGALLLGAIQQRMPGATLRFVPESESDGAALRDGRIDLDVGTVHDRGPEILTAPLFAQRIVGVVRLGHALQTARVTLARFAAQQHVAIAQRGRAREPIDKLLTDKGVARRVALTVPSAYGALMAAAHSDLVACVPEPIARSAAAELGLAIIGLPVAVPAEHVVQAWHPRLDGDAAHQWLRRCVDGLSAHRPPDKASGAGRLRTGTRP
jgi:DNA-binding transcriptional LysR family regulator